MDFLQQFLFAIPFAVAASFAGYFFLGYVMEKVGN